MERIPSIHWQTKVPVAIDLARCASDRDLESAVQVFQDDMAGRDCSRSWESSNRKDERRSRKAAGLLMPYGISENDIARLYDEARRKRS
jgi:hypothetical protein